ncbi:PilZ domain-containing protein [Oleidesulfovibrio sp.]|uniref:PilZ domain-containing protein n=1 Tax=Oleidesulfovibrio sp. TaxID=2909707 RepID=UPI003A8C32C5
MRRICLDLPDELVGAVQKAAGRQGLSPPAWMARTIQHAVDAESNQTMEDRRRFPRIAVGVRGRMRLYDGETTAHAAVEDVSLGGVLLSVKPDLGRNDGGGASLKEGDVFDLVFSLPGNNRPVLLHCRVLRHTAGVHQHIGAQLVAAEWDSMAGLHTFVENTIAATAGTV